MMQLDLQYPNAAGFKASGTSEQAAKEITPKVQSLHARIQNLLHIHGPMTPDECAERMGVDILSIRPRFSELKRKGLIRKTLDQRPNKSGKYADVYEVRA